ncbi:MAG: hypothetical protein VX641_07630 [Planctomycetota bacterium]|nr:hypothetical protein [Planctomycetota bacterium]
MSQPPPIILCALEVERKALSGSSLPDEVLVECCGPGREGVARWAGAHRRLDRPVILAGLAGSLVADHVPGDVVEVEAVVSPSVPRTETRWRLPDALGVPRVDGTSSTRLVNSRPAKRALHATLNASIVDMESLTFVAKGIELGWTFGILRAISDGLDDTLPPGCDRWVDHRGRVSIGAIAGSVLRSPSLVGRLREMNRVTNTAMNRLGAVLSEALSRGPVG